MLDGVLYEVCSPRFAIEVYRCICSPLAAQSSADCALRAIRDLSLKCVCVCAACSRYGLLFGLTSAWLVCTTKPRSRVERGPIHLNSPYTAKAVSAMRELTAQDDCCSRLIPLCARGFAGGPLSQPSRIACLSNSL